MLLLTLVAMASCDARNNNDDGAGRSWRNSNPRVTELRSSKYIRDLCWGVHGADGENEVEDRVINPRMRIVY